MSPVLSIAPLCICPLNKGESVFWGSMSCGGLRQNLEGHGGREFFKMLLFYTDPIFFKRKL